MATQEEIQRVIFDTFASVNEDLEPEMQLAPKSDTIIFGSGGSLDSLGLVTFVVSLESNINDRFGTSVSLTDDAAMANGAAAFHTVQSLSDFLSSRIA